MSDEIRLLNPIGGVSGILFPAGRLKERGILDPSFRTNLSECTALESSGNEKIINYEEKETIFKFVSKQPIFDICSKVVKEMEEMDSRILYWFASGDCMRTLAEKIGKIIRHLAWEGIIQCGFIRSLALWKRLEDIPDAYLILITDKDKRETGGRGLVAVPDIDSGELKIYRNYYEQGIISRKWNYMREEISIAANCRECYEKSEGCFWRRSLWRR